MTDTTLDELMDFWKRKESLIFRKPVIKSEWDALIAEAEKLGLDESRNQSQMYFEEYTKKT
jgi:hypothetical protein